MSSIYLNFRSPGNSSVVPCRFRTWCPWFCNRCRCPSRLRPRPRSRRQTCLPVVKFSNFCYVFAICKLVFVTSASCR